MSKPYELVNFCEIDKFATKSYCAVHDVDPSKNLGDITKVDENKLPEFNCIFGGSPCFVAGTKVYTDCGYKNIEDIACGDNVLTHIGRFMPVLRVGGEHNKEIWAIRAQGFLETYCTDYHPFYVKTTKDAAPIKMRFKDIEPGYYDAMPYLFDDLKVSSYFSGIGAFESALDRVYEKKQRRWGN